MHSEQVRAALRLAGWVCLLTLTSDCTGGILAEPAASSAAVPTNSQPLTPGTQEQPLTSDGNHLAASGGNGIANANASANATDANGNVINGLQQSGKGWSGSLNVAATSAQYQALSLDGIKAKNSGLATTLAKFPAVEAAIRQVASQTGVPNGLLAGVAYQESGFDVKATSTNPDVKEQDVGLTQAPSSAFSGTTWQDPATNLTYFAKAMLSAHSKYQSWGAALRAWNSGDDEVNLRNLASENNNTDPNYVTEILAQHCMGLD